MVTCDEFDTFDEFVEIANTGDPLDASIAKWELLVAKIEAGEVLRNRKGRRLLGTRTCGLCITYFSNHCYGCPVTFVTGNVMCRGSPYTEAYAELNEGPTNAVLNVQPFKDE